MTQWSEQIHNMTWSYSRLSTYEQCPYMFYLNYLLVDDNGRPLYTMVPNFWAAYGSMCHKIFERVFKKQMTLDDAYIEFQDRFLELEEDFPYEGKYSDKYFEKGLEYFGGDWYGRYSCADVVSVEEHMEFDVGGYKFQGFVDLIMRGREYGDINIIDHKSAKTVLGKTGKILKTQQDKADAMKRQLYLYSKPVIEKYGKISEMFVNFFNDNQVWHFWWNQDEYDAAMKWAVDVIKRIEQDADFVSKNDYFFCRKICSFRAECEMKDDEE